MLYFPILFLQDANGIFQEKLVILLTNYASSNLVTPLFGACPLSMAEELAKQNIVLVVVDAKCNVLELDDFYFTLSDKTGTNKKLIILVLFI